MPVTEDEKITGHGEDDSSEELDLEGFLKTRDQEQQICKW